MRKTAVVAFGGNALLRGSEQGTVDEQEKNAYDTCEKVLELIKKNYNVVITHGNGPQVGNLLLKNEAGHEKYKLPKMPIDICVADSQGEIGYMIERQMRNTLNDNEIDKNCVTLVTQVMVDLNDPAFENPTKPIGPFYLKEEADLLTKANKWVFKEDARKRGWRRVVASPQPKAVMNYAIVKELAERGHIVIAAGGGGIPIFRHENNFLEAIEAVIDKDLASALLAAEIEADVLYIVTDVPKAYINFNTPRQKALDTITVNEAKKYLEEGQFGAGSMRPKIRAAILFVENGGALSVITSASEIEKDNCGTRIVK
ncbi:MAG: carbamate kinase [Ignavibacteria bacterium]|jgi:carbamate kinase